VVPSVPVPPLLPALKVPDLLVASPPETLPKEPPKVCPELPPVGHTHNTISISHNPLFLALTMCSAFF
jgi:hypothetical protein